MSLLVRIVVRFHKEFLSGDFEDRENNRKEPLA